MSSRKKPRTVAEDLPSQAIRVVMSSLLPKISLRAQLALGNTTQSLRQSLATQVGERVSSCRRKVVVKGARPLGFKDREKVMPPPVLQLHGLDTLA